jgi:hypothetical protein
MEVEVFAARDGPASPGGSPRMGPTGPGQKEAEGRRSRQDCGDHECYNADNVVDHCYHCSVGTRPHQGSHYSGLRSDDAGMMAPSRIMYVEQKGTGSRALLESVACRSQRADERCTTEDDPSGV